MQEPEVDTDRLPDDIGNLHLLFDAQSLVSMVQPGDVVSAITALSAMTAAVYLRFNPHEFDLDSVVDNQLREKFISKKANNLKDIVTPAEMDSIRDNLEKIRRHVKQCKDDNVRLFTELTAQVNAKIDYREARYKRRSSERLKKMAAGESTSSLRIEGS